MILLCTFDVTGKSNLSIEVAAFTYEFSMAKRDVVIGEGDKRNT